MPFHDLHRNIVFDPPEKLNIARHLSMSSPDMGECSLHEYRREIPEMHLTSPTPQGDAFMAVLSFRASPPIRSWVNGGLVPIEAGASGQMRLFDLRDIHISEVPYAFHTVHLFLPNSAFARYGQGSPTWNWKKDGYEDHAVLNHLMRALLPSLRDPEFSDDLFCEHVLQAASRHIARCYGDMVDRQAARGTLSRQQERLAKELMISRLSGNISMNELASACGLSTDKFGRMFRRTTGKSPYQWILHQRISRAKLLLLDCNYGIVQVALASGFCSQSHFTRMFTRVEGLSPGKWRKRAI